MKRLSNRHWWIVCGCLGSGAVWPQPATDIETVVVTGTRIPGHAPAGSATVIDTARIERRNAADVSTLLADAPGVYVDAPGGRGSVGSVSLRGGEANFTAVLIDGVQVNDPTNTRGGSFDFSTLQLDAIQRIEVIKGPRSAVYGSDALSGVINIITHDGTREFSAVADAEGGSGDYARAGLRLGAPVGAGRYGLQLSAVDDGETRDGQSYRGRALGGKLVLLDTERRAISLTARHAETAAHAFPESSGGPRLAVLRQTDRRDASDSSFGLSVRSRASESLDLHVEASLLEHDEQTRSPGVAPGLLDGLPANRSDNEFSRSALSVFVTTAQPGALSAAAGLAYQRETGDSAGMLMLSPDLSLPSGYRLDRDNLAAYGEVVYVPGGGRWDVSAGLRADRPEGAGTTTNGRLALGYRFEQAPARIYLTWAEGFKLPSLFALGHPLAGNPALEPERVSTSELGLETTSASGRFSGRLAAFRQRFEDLIDFDFESFRSVNRNRVEVDGLEAALSFRPAPGWDLTAHATGLDIDVSGATVLRQRPERQAGVGIAWRGEGGVGVYAGWRYVGERFDASIPTGEQRLDAYTRTDVSLSWAATANVELGFAIDNALDAGFEEAIGFPDPGRRLRVSVRRTFGPAQ